jgi:hypothetical protein
MRSRKPCQVPTCQRSNLASKYRLPLFVHFISYCIIIRLFYQTTTARQITSSSEISSPQRGHFFILSSPDLSSKVPVLPHTPFFSYFATFRNFLIPFTTVPFPIMRLPMQVQAILYRKTNTKTQHLLLKRTPTTGKFWQPITRRHTKRRNQNNKISSIKQFLFIQSSFFR